MMRIYLAIPRSGNVALSGSNIWLNHFYLTLCEMGHDVIVSPFVFDDLFGEEDRVLLERKRITISQALVEHVNKIHQERPIQLFFGYLYSSCITPDVIKSIRATGIVTVNFSCNNVHQFYRVKDIAQFFDFCMVPERSALNKFRQIGARPIHIQMGANPKIFRPTSEKSIYSVTFVGTKYADRGDFIYYLLRNRINARVWGVGWTRETATDLIRGARRAWRFGGSRRLWRGIQDRIKHARPDWAVSRVASPGVDDFEMVNIFNRSKIMLNFAKVLDPENPGRYLKHIRMRDFEVPMTGVFYTAEYVDELEEYYDIGREIICFETREELLDRVRYYLSHPPEREQIRQRGYKRAVNEHTWAHRFTRLFKEIGLA